MFNVGDKVLYKEYIMRRSHPIDEIVETIEYTGVITEICGFNNDIAIPSALVKFDNGGQNYLTLCSLIKIE